MKRARNAAAPPARRPVARRRPDFTIPAAPRRRHEQVLLLPGTWQRYLMLDKEFTGTGIRITYLNGVIEAMSISPLHEQIKSNIADLIAWYCQERGLTYGRKGGPTHRIKEDRAGEPDESFIFERGRRIPQLVIEVALTSGGLDKLDFWGGFPVEEVWIWKRRKLQFHRWQGAAYQVVPVSTLVPGFKKEWAERFAEYEVTSDMIREFRTLL